MHDPWASTSQPPERGSLPIRTAINATFHPCSKEGGCTFKTGSKTLVQHATKHMPEVRALAADLTAGMMVCTVDTAESVSSAEPCHLEQSDEADQAVIARQMPDPATLQ